MYHAEATGPGGFSWSHYSGDLDVLLEWVRGQVEAGLTVTVQEQKVKPCLIDGEPANPEGAPDGEGRR